MRPLKRSLLPIFLLLAQAASCLAGVVTLDEVRAPLRVDGHLEDWPSARMFLLREQAQLIQGKGYWRGPEYFSGRVFLAYDNRQLYIAALVNKLDRVMNDQPLPSLWDGDCLELFFSTESGGKGRSPGDFHLGFTPGTDCKNPRLYCFNKDREVRGARVIARATREGYLLEAGIPLEFLAGLKLGRGREARMNLRLDGGGFNGKRIVQFDLSGYPDSPERPDLWTGIRWLGEASVEVPVAGIPGFSPGRLSDGTRGLTFAGTRTLRGKVTDDKDRPLPGALVSAWPRSGEARTDASGAFELSGVKVYDRTVLYARTEGYSTALAPLSAGGHLLRCHPLPAPARGMIFGEDFPVPVQARLSGEPEPSEGSGALLRLEGMEKEGEAGGWEERLSYARRYGYEPLVEAPLDPARAADLVRKLNLGMKAGVRYWVLGDGPDRAGRLGARSGEEALSDLINAYRECFNGMKRLDSSILILGPELCERYRGEGGDWLTPFLTFNGDILDLVSIQRFALPGGVKDASAALEDSLRKERSLLRSLKGRVVETTGRAVPLAVASAWAVAQPGTLEGLGGAGDFLELLWMAEQGAIAFQEGLALDLFAPGRGGKDLSPQARVLRKVLAGMKGLPLEARLGVKLPSLSFYPCQDSGTKEVALLLVNREDRVRRIRVRLDGKPADLSIEAGLEQEFEAEIPAYSASLWKLGKDKARGQATFYTKAMAEKGLGPSNEKVKAW